MVRRPSVGFVSLGCPKNLVDTERMIGFLSEDGAVITGDQSQADIVVINTCGFLEPAKMESMHSISEFVGLKKEGKLKGVVVTGCMTERYLGLMSTSFPEVDAFLQTKDFSKIVEVVRAIDTNDTTTLSRRRELLGEVSVEQLEGHSELEDFVSRSPGKRPYAYVKISEGCNRVCSFCIIPRLRGKHHSRSVEGIVQEARQLASFGTKELILIAQDLTSYGRDIGTDLLTLLRELDEVDGIEWIRLMYNYPRFFSDELIEFLATSKKFCGYLDIPFQHFSAPVLKAMRRPESPEEIQTLIAKLRAALPDVSLRTTLMVGFPGETERDFETLLEFVRATGFDQLGTFTYYQEKDTPSAELPDQVPEEIKQRRLNEIMTLQKSIQKKGLKALAGQTREVIIDGFSEKTKQGPVYRGRHSGQAPEIDGVTYVLSTEGALEIGEIYTVELGRVMGHYDLIGVVASPTMELARAGA